jgi:hypothetical protein
MGKVNEPEDDKFLVETRNSETSIDISRYFINCVRSGTKPIIRCMKVTVIEHEDI